MEKQHRYTLQPYAGPASRFHCPQCRSREKTFSRYIDTETGQHLSDHVGKCERLNNCAYHYTPKQFFTDNPNSSRQGWNITGIDKNRPLPPFKAKAAPPPAPISYMPKELFMASLRPGIDIATVGRENAFIAFLISVFGDDVAATLTARYYIGTSKHWPGATVFWQIDKAGGIRAGKIMQYRIQPGHTFAGQDCKRNKTNKPATYWAHKAAKLEGFNLAQCLFGEHLLRAESNKKVGIVESEKTAIIASAYLPDFIWLACGGLELLSATRCKAIEGRSVTLFPDLKGLSRWEAKGRELAAFCDCSVSDLLERKASEADRVAGLDLADFLLRQPPPDNYTPKKEAETPATPSAGSIKAPATEAISAFTDMSGRLYIATPFADTYTVYSSLEHYNQRLECPYFIKQTEAATIGRNKAVTIDLCRLIACEVESPINGEIAATSLKH